MSDSNASYAFLPWMRRGVSAYIGEGASLDQRLRVPVEVSFGEDRQASATLEFFGPGEITGLDHRVVIRTWPPPNVHEAEPNFFAMIEFDQAHLPWHYTPATSDGDRLQPWLCLIVLKDKEIAGFVQSSGARPLLPVVTVDNAPLPILDQAWAWAHVQVAGAEDIKPHKSEELLATEPHRLVSRLLCPRRLEPQTRYTAFLVPAFESGRLAGIGQPVAGLDPLDPAWSSGSQSVQLPVYYHWRFTTGIGGGFEELVKRLKPSELPPTVGIRDMDANDPGAKLPAAAEGPLGLEGALRAPATQSTPWPDSQRGPFVGALRGFLNLPAELLEDGGTPAISAPLYGRWHAAQDKLSPGEEPVWFQQVNSDPRWRVAAGLGTQVVRANQRQLMASAWRQVEGIEDINHKLRLTQVACELAARIHQRHLADDDDLVLQVTAPVHDRVPASPVTIAARLRESPIAEGVLGAGWRRAARPLGPIGRRQGRPRGERSQVVARINRGELSPAPPPPAPVGMATPSGAGASLAPGCANRASIARLRTLWRWLIPLGVVALVVAGIVLSAGGPVGLVTVVGAMGGAGVAGGVTFRRLADRLELRLAVRDGTLAQRAVEAVPARPNFVATESGVVGGTPPAHASRGRAGEDSPSARAFRAATTAVLARAASQTVEQPPLQPVNLPELREKLVAALDPRATIGASLRRRLHLADTVLWQPEDPLEPVLVGPEFPQPMYKYLAELSQDWLLPGVEQVPANTVSLLETNQRFVEAFMLGLNHEMGRELLWREYPTDQRRTYFRQFWDPSGYVPPPGETLDPEKLKDIQPIHQWQPSTQLGEDSSRELPDGGKHLVLLVRGDVVHRYPNLMVYAARAVWDEESEKRVPGEEEQQPVFSGTLEPDIAFFGFPLTEAQVRGSEDPEEGDPGWFFILQEQPSEPRFGLDATGGDDFPASWDDVTWEHVGTAPGGHLDIEATSITVADPNGATWGLNGAHMALITLQRPVRVAIHAADMLPSQSM